MPIPSQCFGEIFLFSSIFTFYHVQYAHIFNTCCLFLFVSNRRFCPAHCGSTPRPDSLHHGPIPGPDSFHHGSRPRSDSFHKNNSHGLPYHRPQLLLFMVPPPPLIRYHDHLHSSLTFFLPYNMADMIRPASISPAYNPFLISCVSSSPYSLASCMKYRDASLKCVFLRYAI